MCMLLQIYLLLLFSTRYATRQMHNACWKSSLQRLDLVYETSECSETHVLKRDFPHNEMLSALLYDEY